MKIKFPGQLERDSSQGTRGFRIEKQLALKYDFSLCRETGGGSLLAVVQ